jgi:hypothetical protein
MIKTGIAVIIVGMTFGCVRTAHSMTFNLESIDLRPISGIHHHVYANGEIVEGDAERLLKVLQSSRVPPNDNVSVYLDSPGGSVMEGIKLGKMISSLKANTNVGVQSSDRLAPFPGQCASACVLAYLGGNYRFLNKDSNLGVHQFSLTNGIQTGKAIAITQVLAAQIVEHIRQSRANVEFFTLMTSTLPSDIYLVPHDKLRELRVVTDGIWDESWSFDYNGGITYLKIWQQSYNGENKLILSCNKHVLFGFVYAQPPESTLVGKIPHSVGVFINGNLITIPDKLVIDRPEMGPRFVSAFFIIPPKLAGEIIMSQSIGAAIQPPDKALFFGFQINTAGGRDKLARLVSDCHLR